MENNNILFKKFKYIDSIRIYTHIHNTKIKELYQNDIVKLIKEYTSNGKTIDLKSVDSWLNKSTFVNFVLSYNKETINIEISVIEQPKHFYNKKKYYLAQFTDYPIEYLKIFEDDINYKFNEYCEDLYYKEEESKRKERILEISKKLLDE